MRSGHITETGVLTRPERTERLAMTDEAVIIVVALQHHGAGNYGDTLNAERRLHADGPLCFVAVFA